MPPDTDPTSQEPIFFRVAAVERYSPSARMKPGHLMLRVEFLNLDEPLRVASFHLPPDRYRAHREAIDEALAFGAIYWVDRNAATVAGFSLRDDETVAQHLLRAIADRQVISQESGDE